MEPFDYFEELNKCRYLFLKELVEPNRNVLRIRAIEGKVSKTTVPLQIAGKSLGKAYPVEIGSDSARYELTWNSYVLYQVMNEMFGLPEPSTDGILGRLASVYRSSSLLDFVTRHSGASNDSPTKLLHFSILCADHLVDVISTDRPACLRIGPTLKIH